MQLFPTVSPRTGAPLVGGRMGKGFWLLVVVELDQGGAPIHSEDYSGSQSQRERFSLHGDPACGHRNDRDAHEHWKRGGMDPG